MRSSKEPLEKRQIEALRKTPRITTFKLMMEMSDFMLCLATKGGKRSEMEKLAWVMYGREAKTKGRMREKFRSQ